MKPYKLHPLAKADLLSAAEYYERESRGLAGRFAAEMDRLVQEVCAHPGVNRIFWADARRHFGGRFPYAVTIRTFRRCSRTRRTTRRCSEAYFRLRSG